MANQLKQKVFFTATKEHLACRACYEHLWRTTVSLTYLSSGGLIIAIEEFFRDTDILGIEIHNPDGSYWTIPFIDSAFPCNDDNESGRRWVSNYKKPDETGLRPKSMSRCLLKLQCVELLVHATVAKYARELEIERCSLTHLPLGW